MGRSGRRAGPPSSPEPLRIPIIHAAEFVLDSKSDSLLMLDDDMVPAMSPDASRSLPTALEFVAERRARESGSANPASILEMVDRNSAAIRPGIQEVAALPTGVIRYDVRTFAKLPTPWCDYEWTDKDRTDEASTEDVYETRNARLMGMPQFVHWDCWAGHAEGKLVGKPQVITRDAVHESLREAVLRGVDSDQRLRFVVDDRVSRSPFEGRTPAPGSTHACTSDR